ncbi:MAG: GreA/GreB family elongation factor [bacterium]|nr:GreA/GreB family elongation factor [bacterium]
MQFPKKRMSDMLKVRDEGPIYLTPEGLEHLHERLIRLKKALPDYIEETRRTAAYGDRSDNAEYKEAKSILRRTHRQILSIEDRIKRVVTIVSDKNKKGVVQLGSTVLLESKGMQSTFRILGPHETDPAKGRISHQSPLGAALMNHTEGDIVTIQTPHGTKEYRIIKIS